MTGPAVSDDVRRFIAENVTSAEQLDILVLLHGQPDRAWTAEEVSQAVYTVPASATMRLEELVARGLLSSGGEANPTYRYAPANDGTASRVEALTAAYRANRVAIINLVFGRAPDPVRSFADAFRLRKDG